MSKNKWVFGLTSGFAACLGVFYFYSSSVPSGSYEMASGAYGSMDKAKTVFTSQMNKSLSSQGVLDRKMLTSMITAYNNQNAPAGSGVDPLDHFISALPENYRFHFTLVHRSFSPQKSTPSAPRVILFGPDAKVLMAFNSTEPVIELIEWNDEKTQWDFSELTFQENKIIRDNNPAKCVMCHAGTPKPLDIKNAPLYKNALKPIFPQYPFWPGFYGSVNDIVGLKKPGSRDTIMLNLKDTKEQVRGLTFDSTEELFRLSKLLETNPKYTQLIQEELQVHQEHFENFISGIKSRARYRHLVTLKDFYQRENQALPPYLEAAPFRRTFDKEYGHYLLRPNFYLSSLLTFRQAQVIAKEIQKSPIYADIKHSLIARKYNCGSVSVNGLKIQELDPSFDLLYPNQATQDSRDKQYLLAYQYNLVAAAKGGAAALPLHAWNLEGNEDIASYHYGNVYSDLNEVVLWNLATSAFPTLKSSNARSAAEERHFEMPAGAYFKQYLEEAKGFVSRMGQKEINFAGKSNSYYDSATRFKALPVSAYCDSTFIPAAKKEMEKLAEQKKVNKLPHQAYALDSRLYSLAEIIPANERAGLNATKMACMGCHASSQEMKESAGIQPQLNVDWYSNGYSQDLHSRIQSVAHPQAQPREYKELLLEILSEAVLPVPYGNRMPYGRRPMEDFAEKCERLIIENAYKSSGPPKMSELVNCGKESDPQSFGCRCKKLNQLQHVLYKELYKEPATK
ncbi:hypothetical protein [Bdellovibrio sp. HCB337]|uniref:hypothetical protein n=1 Tax=Bdellovibrio sp. HCB337 TaxID=3394358 RepID=UPI0039A6390F